MKKLFALSAIAFGLNAQAQNLLSIPDTLNGTAFNLSILDTTHEFYSGFTTNTYGVNASYLGPTLLLNQGDSVSMFLHNTLMDTTTIHWHGMHVSPANDGGPHIYIPPGTTWNPQFKVRDHAATYWYHPHLHMMTNAHASMGAAGLIIVRDTIEKNLALPRRYGVDDFPLVVQTKSFDASKQILFNNAYDSIVMVNGTLSAYLPTPAQVVRFRLLNASSERVYYFGLEGSLTFYQIASDGGLLAAPVSMTRLQLAPGERAEILVDFTGKNGQSIDLISYASALPNGIYGALQPGMSPVQVIPGYDTNPLNGADFTVLTFNVTDTTASPVTAIPATLVAVTPWSTSLASVNRTLLFEPTTMGPTAIQGPFTINGVGFDMETINYTIPKDNIEMWTLDNQSPIAHPFHIHDVQFYIVDINGATPPLNMQGRKDVVLVRPMQTVTFITKFETFCDTMLPYMYHCHMLPHEDDGMMGQFLVSCDMNGVNEIENSFEFNAYPNPAQSSLTIEMPLTNASNWLLSMYNSAGQQVMQKQINGTTVINVAALQKGIYAITISGKNKRAVKTIVIE